MKVMNAKKSQAANRTKNSGLYFLIGLNIVLGMVFISLEISKSQTSKPEPIFQKKPEKIYEEVIIVSLPPETVVNIETPIAEPPPVPTEVKVVDEVQKMNTKEWVNSNTKIPIRTYSDKNKTRMKPPKLPPNSHQASVSVDEEVPLVNRSNAKKAMVYPGCEDFKTNKELYICFNKKFSRDLQNQLSPFQMDQGEKVQQIVLQFEIDTEGNLRLKDHKSYRIDKDLQKNALSAFAQLSAYLKRKAKRNKGIQPAINQQNQKATMEYTIPIKFYPNL